MVSRLSLHRIITARTTKACVAFDSYLRENRGEGEKNIIPHEQESKAKAANTNEPGAPSGSETAALCSLHHRNYTYVWELSFQKHRKSKALHLLLQE